MLASGVATPRMPIVMIVPYRRRRRPGSARGHNRPPTRHCSERIQSSRVASAKRCSKRASAGDQNVNRIRQRRGDEPLRVAGDGEIAEA